MKWRICVKSCQEVEADLVEGPPDAESEQLPVGRKYRHAHFFNSNIHTMHVLHVK